MTDKHLELLDGTDYKVRVECDEGVDVITLTKDVFAHNHYVDYDIIAQETIYDRVTEAKIINFAEREIAKHTKAINLYGTYTGKKETE